VQALEELRKRQPLTPQQQFFLCKLYEAEGNWPKARGAIQSALAADGNNPLYLVQYVAALLRQDERGEARVGLNRLEQLYPHAFETVSLQASLLAKEGKGEELVQALREYVGWKDATPSDQAERVRLAAELLEELGQEHRAVRAATGPAAEEFYRQAASLKEPEGTLALAEYLGRQGRLPEALEQCERARVKGLPEAVAAASIAVLRSGQPTEAQCQDFERWLVAQVEKRPDSSTLLESLAALREIQGRYAEAEALYRKILTRDKTNAVASNNLAYLLALNSDRRGEALTLISGLIETAGPAAELLDTRAVVHLAAGRTEQAIEDLQGALSQKKLAPFRFHLAWTYDKTGNRGEAVRAFREAQSSGLTTASLHPLERETYERLLAELGTK
jgi:tetratricopeptide (TPR) repeat protein